MNSILAKEPSALWERDSLGRDPLLAAIFAGRTELVLALLLLQPYATRDEDGNAALHLAVIDDTEELNKDCVTLTRSLIQAGVEVNPRNNGGQSPLHLALVRNLKRCEDRWIDLKDCLALVTLLLGADADSNVADSQGYTPLHIAVERACSGNFIEVINRLLDGGAEPNAVTRLGQTPLHISAQIGFDTLELEVVRASQR